MKAHRKDSDGDLKSFSGDKMSLLGKLIEKKDLFAYIDNRIEHLKEKMDSVIKSEPEKNREKVKGKFQGRTDELSELKKVVHENELKDKSKMYFRTNKKEKIKLNRDWQDERKHLDEELKELLPMVGCGEGEDYISCDDCARTYGEAECKDIRDTLSKGSFVVRLYDGFDNEWMDVSEPVSREDAERILAENTNNGTKNASFADIDYYCIFPSTTQMLYSVETTYKRSGWTK